MGHQDQREAGQGPVPPRSRRGRGGLSGSGAPARHPARGRPARPEGPAYDAVSRAADSERLVKAKVHITLKSGVLDPQGRAIAHALGQLGFDGVGDVRQGKYIELDIAERSEEHTSELQSLMRIS